METISCILSYSNINISTSLHILNLNLPSTPVDIKNLHPPYFPAGMSANRLQISSRFSTVPIPCLLLHSGKHKLGKSHAATCPKTHAGARNDKSNKEIHVRSSPPPHTLHTSQRLLSTAVQSLREIYDYVCFLIKQSQHQESERSKLEENEHRCPGSPLSRAISSGGAVHTPPQKTRQHDAQRSRRVLRLYTQHPTHSTLSPRPNPCSSRPASLGTYCNSAQGNHRMGRHL